MPTYTFHDNVTNTDEDIFMKMSEVETFLTENPHKTKIITSNPSIVSGVEMGASNKPDRGFRDILRNIKKNNRRSTINTFD